MYIYIYMGIYMYIYIYLYILGHARNLEAGAIPTAASGRPCVAPHPPRIKTSSFQTIGVGRQDVAKKPQGPSASKEEADTMLQTYLDLSNLLHISPRPS